MAKIGGQPGNQNATKAALARRSLLRALGHESGVDYIKSLDEIAAALIKKAKDGDIAATKEIFDRLDGKAVQAIQADVKAELEVVELRRYAD